jgi:hypothetical protein
MESLFPGKKNPFLHDTIWDKYQWETSTTDLSQKDQKVKLIHANVKKMKKI